MGFKKMQSNFTFTDISLFPHMEKNRAIKRMEQINAIVDWTRIEALLTRSYPVGKCARGPRSLSPCPSYEMPAPPTVVSHRFRSGVGNANQR